jgi:serine/threonine protein kinase
MSHPWEKNWDFIRSLAKGGQGITRLLRCKTNPSITGVLKYLVNNRNPSARARMSREVANLNSLSPLGARIPKVLEHNTETFFDPSSELYLIMEYISGETLKSEVELNGPVSIDRAIEISIDLCETMKIAHLEGIVHRDLKPDNIILSTEKHGVYIVDYGLSFNETDEDLTETLETFRNKFLDLPECNSPGGNRRDPRSDVTAVCACFYYMLTGHRPGQLHDSAGKPPHQRDGYKIRESHPSDYRVSQIEMLLDKGLVVPITSRFQSIDDLVQRFRFLKELSASNGRPNPIETAKELSAQLRSLDRKTQLAEFRRPASDLLNSMKDEFIKMYGSLERFQCAFTDIGKNIPLESGLDEVCGPVNVVLSVNNHEAIRVRSYKVGSRGEQCIVCACDFEPATDRRKATPIGWKEIAWYETTTSGVLRSLRDEFTIWLDNNLKSLAKDVLGSL